MAIGIIPIILAALANAGAIGYGMGGKSKEEKKAETEARKEQLKMLHDEREKNIAIGNLQGLDYSDNVIRKLPGINPEVAEAIITSQKNRAWTMANELGPGKAVNQAFLPMILKGLQGGQGEGEQGVPQSSQVSQISQTSSPKSSDVSKSSGGMIGPSVPQSNVTGLPSSEIANRITLASQKAGLDPILTNTIASVESGYSPKAKNPTSTAHGLFQMIDNTWTGVGGTPETRFDVNAQIDNGIAVIKQNTEHLKKVLGRDPQPNEIYLAHGFGAKGAEDLLKANPNDKAINYINEEALRVNKWPLDITVGQLLQKFPARFNAKYTEFGGKQNIQQMTQTQQTLGKISSTSPTGTLSSQSLQIQPGLTASIHVGADGKPSTTYNLDPSKIQAGMFGNYLNSLPKEVSQGIVADLEMYGKETIHYKDVENKFTGQKGVAKYTSRGNFLGVHWHDQTELTPQQQIQLKGAEAEEEAKRREIGKTKADMELMPTGNTLPEGAPEMLPKYKIEGQQKAETQGMVTSAEAQSKKTLEVVPAKKALSLLEDYGSKILTQSSAGGRVVKGVMNTVKSWAGAETERSYSDYSKAFLGQIARLFGAERGVLTNQDVQRAASLIPGMFASKELATKRFSELKNFISDLEGRPVKTDFKAGKYDVDHVYKGESGRWYTYKGLSPKGIDTWEEVTVIPSDKEK